MAEQQRENNQANPPGPLVEGEDYYLENGMMVFTSAYLLRREYCCGNCCRECPYEKD